MFSEVDIRNDFRSNDKNHFLYGGYRPTRILVLVYTFLVLCRFLLAVYFRIGTDTFPAIFSSSFRASSDPIRQPRRLSALEIQHQEERLVLAMVLIGIGIASFIVFLKLMARFYHNATLFKGSRLETSQGNFLISWFIPFANLYIPFRTMQSILDLSRPRTHQKSSSFDGLLMAYWVTAFFTYVLVTTVIAIAIEYGDLFINGEMPLTIRLIDSANSIAREVLLCLLIYRVDHYQTVRARRPDEAQTSCVYCGEPVAVSEGNCPMCGRKIPIGAATPG